MALLRQLNSFLGGFDFKSTGKWFIISTAIGIVAGVGGIAFQLLSQIVIHYSLGQVAGFSPGEAAGEESIFSEIGATFQPWMVIVVMTVGGLFSGILVYTFAPEAEGHGTDAAIDSFHNKRGQIRYRIPFVKTIASAITIGTGGSGGREGPIAQIGAGFGSFLADKLELPVRDRRIMLAAGMGAGVGAVFRAPLAGALFAAEIMYRDADLESDVIVPAAISSITGYSVYSLLLPGGETEGFKPLFGEHLTYQLGSLIELLPMTLLAMILVLVGIAYIKIFYGMHKVFKKVPVKPHFRPAIGAALAGLIGIGLYYLYDKNEVTLGVLSTGYGALQHSLENASDIGLKMLLIVAGFKILTTSLSIGSGGSGGVFGPSMVIGGCLGAAVGLWFNELFGTNTAPEVYGIVGMAGFFAGAAHSPISTIIMVSEMTGDYGLLVPTMWVSTLCFLFCRKWTLYEKQVPTRLESPAHRGDFIVDILEGIKVGDVFKRDHGLVLIPESTSLDDIVHKLAETQQHHFPVVDKEERLVGIFTADDVRSYLFDETIWKLAVARDVMITDIVHVCPDDDLNTSLQRFTSLNVDELPVLDDKDSGKFLGMLRHKELIAFYNRRLMQHKQSIDA